MLCVRQISAYQVTHNLESQKLQYVMQERLRHLGWREIEVVDEDLGRSAAGTVARSGFDRMVDEGFLGKVGAGAAREVCRPGDLTSQLGQFSGGGSTTWQRLRGETSACGFPSTSASAPRRIPSSESVAGFATRDKRSYKRFRERQKKSERWRGCAD